MGIEFLNFLKNKKKKSQNSSGFLPTVEPEKVPEYEEGYSAQDNTIIRLVADPKRKPKKAYQVYGIDDLASKNNWKGWLYLAPVIVLVAVFLLYPLINTMFISFTWNYNYSAGTFQRFTFDNFGIILGLKDYVTSGGAVATERSFVRYALPNTMFITFITVPVSIFLALIISVALNSIKVFQKFLQTVFFLPYVTNAVAIGMVFAVLFGADATNPGLINYIFHTNITWIWRADQWTAMVPLCIYIVWNSIPFKILVLLSGLQGIDKQYYQAAQIDAAPKWKILTKITVPLLSPQILYLMITSFIGAFKEYTSVVAIFRGPSTSGATGTDKNMYTMVYYVYDNLQTQTSFAAAAAVFLFVIILVFTVIQFAVSSRRVHY